MKLKLLILTLLLTTGIINTKTPNLDINQEKTTKAESLNEDDIINQKKLEEIFSELGRKVGQAVVKLGQDLHEIVKDLDINFDDIINELGQELDCIVKGLEANIEQTHQELIDSLGNLEEEEEKEDCKLSN